jgi:hypothetical protein
LAKQLQNLYDRIPQKGSATNVILTLLEICRTSQNTNGGGAITLKPPTQPHEQAKTLSICNGSSCGIDKETNTSFDNLVWQQLNDSGCRFMVSDQCDKDNHISVSKGKSCSKSKCCEVNNTTKTCSTNSINFDNLQLQCMCSSDNNSLEEYQIEPCDNSSITNLPASPCKHHHPSDSYQSGSFRERLLNFTGASVRYDESRTGNNLRKRNSELVLGTNFDNTSISGGVYKGNNQSYRISCDNIFSNKPSATSPSTALSETADNNKSNHSLSTDSDRKSQIPYSFLERPTMKLSQSEDRNLRELKIALSSSLPSANNSNNSNNIASNKNQLIGNLKSTQTVTQQSHSYTSSSSASSKVDKTSSSVSASSTSDALLRTVKKTDESDIINDDMRIRMMTDETNKQQDTESINNQNDNKMITAASKLAVDHKNSATTATSNVNNNNINNSNNGSGKKRKIPEGKLAIDLNDRSRDEVSV